MRVNVDWRRHKAVVIESDDWGLAAWVADEPAYRALAETPVFQSAAGRVYGRSTLERADEVAALGEVLSRVRGADGLAPVWQANTVAAAPDFARLGPSGPVPDVLPLVDPETMPGRWARPGLRAAIDRGIEAGWWWPELHGLHHVPARAWLAALRRGDADARRAMGEASLVCAAVQEGGEYDDAESDAGPGADLDEAIARFTRRFGRAPRSLCPPDYRWDRRLETLASERGLDILQGASERVGRRPARLHRVLDAWRWPAATPSTTPFRMPPRIAFEPRGHAHPAGASGLEAAWRRVRAAWQDDRPAIVSTHRANYAHLDPAWSEAGRVALAQLLGRLCEAGARFLVDAEVRDLVGRGWSSRALGRRGMVVRALGSGIGPVRLHAPEGVVGATIRGRSGHAGDRVDRDGGEFVVTLAAAEAVIEWSPT